MMKAPDLWYRDDRAVLDSLHRPGSRRVLRKTQMRPGLFVVLEVVSKNPVLAPVAVESVTFKSRSRPMASSTTAGPLWTSSGQRASIVKS